MSIKIISGGQTGVDRAALDAALEAGIPCGGWCPKGRKAEDGRIADKYPLQETTSSKYAVRTEWNVRDSDGTLVITRGQPTGGTAYTIACARMQKKPVMIFDLDTPSPLMGEGRGEGDNLCNWLTSNNIHTLNIAGPRESTMRGIYNDARQLALSLLKVLHDRSSKSPV